MICQACKEDHRTLINKEWCDRSLLEIENDYLKAENEMLFEALTRVMYSDHVLRTEFKDYSEALSNAKKVLEKVKNKCD